MNRHLITTAASGKEIYANLMRSPLSQNVSRNPHLLTLAKEVVSPLNLTLPAVTMEQDMGRSIGYSDQLETREKDQVFYARQTKLGDYTRFVKHRKNDQTSFLTIKLQVDDAGDYELVDAWIGRLFPPMPTSPNATEQSAAYWENHAIVYNGQSLLASTITKDCPY